MSCENIDAAAQGKRKAANSHEIIADEIRRRGYGHRHVDDLDELEKTVIACDDLPERVLLTEGFVSVAEAGPDEPVDEVVFTIKARDFGDEETRTIVKALPLEQGTIDFNPADSQSTPLYNLVLERTRAEKPIKTIEIWRSASPKPGSEVEKVSDKPWDFSEADYGDADKFCAACIIDLNKPGAEKVKGNCKLPVREPGGALNSNALSAAAQRIGMTDAPPEEKKGAARKLISLYQEAGKEPPESLVNLAKAEGVFNARILKVDEEEHMVYGVVMEPDTEDTQGDFASSGEIMKAAHNYLEQKQKLGFMHRIFGFGQKLRIMESYIAPADFELEGEVVKKGSWVMAVRVLVDELWQKVKSGEITGFSIGGTGKRMETGRDA